MARSLLALLAAALLAGPPAFAGDLTVVVTDASGVPVPNAVVTVPGELDGHAVDAPLEMAQQDVQFDPFVLVVPAGADVAFPNRDRVRHHVYSFARGNQFELELYGREQERSVAFETPGVVPLGCNIHDEMIAFIRVVDTPHAQRTGADGRAVLAGVADGPHTLTVWHPYASGDGNAVTITADPAAGPVAVTLELAGGAPSGR